KMTTIPGKLRDAFDKDVVRYGIKTFEIIKDNETIIVNDALWARLKNAGVKDSELGYIKWIIQSELPGRFNNKISGHIFKMRIAEYLFPIKINRLRNTAFESMTIMGRNKGEGTNYGVWSFDLPFNVKQVHNYWNNNQSLGWMRGYEETRATTKEEQSTGIAEQVKTGVFNVNEIQSQLQYTKAPKWEDLKVGDKVKLNGREYI